MFAKITMTNYQFMFSLKKTKKKQRPDDEINKSLESEGRPVPQKRTRKVMLFSPAPN